MQTPRTAEKPNLTIQGENFEQSRMVWRAD
jgi:hypothetical protein